mgnify:CR=1 FL=1
MIIWVIKKVALTIKDSLSIIVRYTNGEFVKVSLQYLDKYAFGKVKKCI